MSRPSHQAINRYYFEVFRKKYPLPSGTIRYNDRPDVILEGAKRIGIEITRLFHEEGFLTESEQFQMALRDKVVSKAQRMYEAKNGRKFEISFGFDKANPIRNKKSLTTKLLQLAERIESYETGQVRKNVFDTIPELSFVYLNAREYADARWRVVQVYDVPVISRDRLLERVKRKELQATEYEKCDAYWLLIVVDFMNPAQDQEIQVDGFEKIQTDIFEKIIVYRTHFREVFEVS